MGNVAETESDRERRRWRELLQDGLDRFERSVERLVRALARQGEAPRGWGVFDMVGERFLICAVGPEGRELAQAEYLRLRGLWPGSKLEVREWFEGEWGGQVDSPHVVAQSEGPVEECARCGRRVERPEGFDRALRMLTTYASAAKGENLDERAEGIEVAIEVIKREMGGAS